MDKILVINCGSSSVKYELFRTGTFERLTKGVVERIAHHEDYTNAIRTIREKLIFANFIKSIKQIKGIGHRVVHGGEEFKNSTLINKKVINSIKKFIELAPLHNPPALAGIEAAIKFFPGVKQVAVFDTSFHAHMPDYSFIYGIPYDFYKKNGIRRYGFHGTSHRFVSGKAAETLNKPLSRLKIVTVHLGNGCSMAAVKNGVSVDTTMGFTPLEGLIMGTRSGDIDPAIVLYMIEHLKMDVKAVNRILNKKSGLLGISGISNDMRDIITKAGQGNKRAKLALDIFIYRIKKYIGAYAAAMNGLDAVVFTGGIGENAKVVRGNIEKGLNNVFRKTKFITIATNEELLIARDTYKLVKGA